MTLSAQRMAAFPPGILDKKVKDIVGKYCICCGKKIDGSANISTEDGATFFDLICQDCADRSFRSAVKQVKEAFEIAKLEERQGPVN